MRFVHSSEADPTEENSELSLQLDLNEDSPWKSGATPAADSPPRIHEQAWNPEQLAPQSSDWRIPQKVSTETGTPIAGSNILDFTRSSLTSSEDDILFAGRNSTQPHGSSKQPLSSCRKHAKFSSMAEVGDFHTHSGISLVDSSEFDAQMRAKSNSRSGRRKQQNKSRLRKDNVDSSEGDDNAAFDDYVTNLRENAEWSDTAGDAEGSSQMDGPEGLELQAYEGMPMSDGTVGTVSYILPRRQRPNGHQSVIACQQLPVDDALWDPLTPIAAPAVPLEDGFDDAQKLSTIQLLDIQSEYEDAESAIYWGTDDDAEANEDIEAKIDLLEQCKTRLSNERSTRMLQSQDALAILSMDVESFVGANHTRLADEELGTAQPAKLCRLKVRKAHEDPSLSHKSLHFSMDEETIAPEGKGARGHYNFIGGGQSHLSGGFKTNQDHLEFGLSDSDIAYELRAAWEVDRSKKRAKKQEREALRARGLLGKNNRIKPDLKVRYSDGMSMDHVQEELEDFLSNEFHDTLTLPPMDKRDRKIIHEIASFFGLKSKSQGSGNSRFPVLHKTSRTQDFHFGDFVQLRNRLNRPFFSRMDRKGRKRNNTTPKRSGPIDTRANIGYREGEAVGGTAPEIGAGNRGRVMLEKMGWSNGTALGAVDNKGIMTPIEQIVRNSRAGLG